MKVKMLALVACLVVPFQLATADIKADFKAGLSIAKVLANATAGGMSVENAVTQMVALQPKKAALIVDAAISIKCSNAVTSVLKTQCSSAITSAAIAAGADPALITPATAAGPGSRAITTTVSAPAPGGAGGGVASPN